MTENNSIVKKTIANLITILRSFDFLQKSDVVDNLSSTNSDVPLSANQGSILQGQISSTNPYFVKSLYSLGGTSSAFDFSNVTDDHFQWFQTPIFVFVKNTIGDNVANATVKITANGSVYPILDKTTGAVTGPIKGGVWKKGSWGLFFIPPSAPAQLCDVLSVVAETGSYTDLSNKPIIPSQTSDLTNDSGFITSSSVPSASSTTPSADTTNGSVGTGVTWARSNHTHPKSSLYAEASHTHSEYVNPTIVDNLTTNDATKVLSAKQGKVLNDMIGDAIEYINQ